MDALVASTARLEQGLQHATTVRSMQSVLSELSIYSIVSAKREPTVVLSLAKTAPFVMVDLDNLVLRIALHRTSVKVTLEEMMEEIHKLFLHVFLHRHV
jgi:hypothetical protein